MTTPPLYVRDLPTAYDAYWKATTPRECQAAYHEILLYGGEAGYIPDGWHYELRNKIAAWLRRLAWRIQPK